VVLVEFARNTPDQGALAASGAVVSSFYPETGLYEVISTRGESATELAEHLRSHPGVIAAEADHGIESPEARGMSVSFNDGDFVRSDVDGQSFLEALHVAAAHALATGDGLRIALLDTGIDPNHPDLDGRFTAGRNMVENGTAPWERADGVDNDLDGAVDEAYGHGTHLAGLLATLAPDAEIVVYRVLDAEGRGKASDVHQAIIRAVQDGADVINLSLGMYEPFLAVEKAVTFAEDHGVVVVAAVGNDATDSHGQYPALYPAVIGVGSSDAAGTLSPFSSYGPSLAVTAPGEGILSLYPGGSYAAWTGTSMASAMVSALCALVLERSPDLAPGEVAQRIETSAVPGTGIPGITGAGRIDFLNALE